MSKRRTGCRKARHLVSSYPTPRERVELPDTTCRATRHHETTATSRRGPAPRSPNPDPASPHPPISLFELTIYKFKQGLPWREAGPPNHHDDKVDSDQEVVNKTTLSEAGYRRGRDASHGGAGAEGTVGVGAAHTAVHPTP